MIRGANALGRERKARVGVHGTKTLSRVGLERRSREKEPSDKEQL